MWLNFGAKASRSAVAVLLFLIIGGTNVAQMVTDSPPVRRATLVVENPLLHWRKRHRVTQAALGKACGVSAGTISQIEHRHIEPTVRLVARLARHTGISVARLVSFAVGREELASSETVIDFAAKAGERQRIG